ncbi:unnamed protein product [Mytilus coruscus]|uniref:Uncharacterized protein n=1 Tax=Mytilus coruscus TaxID=42192 RepID=A0A6J8A8Y4_MYTCO|nr:unnamed protein product [Mytilus coruscus]
MAKRNRLSASSTDWTKCCLCPEDTTYPMKSSDEGYKMLGKNIPLFHEVNALPIPLDIRRLNDGEEIESTMKRKMLKYHNLFRKFNNTNLERAQKRHMSPIPSGSSSEYFNFKCGDMSISFDNAYRYLGLHINEFMEHKSTIREITKSASRALSAVYTKFLTCGGMSFDVYTKLYKALIESVLLHGVGLWGHNNWRSLNDSEQGM